jgi:hypothetical protein
MTKDLEMDLFDAEMTVDTDERSNRTRAANGT